MKESSVKVIIVGGGTAGSIVSKNLSSKFNVTVIDKGLNTRVPVIYRIPLMIGLLLNRETGYINKTKILFNSDRSVPFFHSNLIGGASLINGCVHVMGSTVDWRNLLIRFGVTFDDFINSYKNMFTKRSEVKKIQLTKVENDWIDRAFFSALNERGVGGGDVEWTDAVGSGGIYNTSRVFTRSSVMDLDPFKCSKVIDNCRIDRLVVNKNSEIVGVFNGQEIILGDYVFLCAGVIETNALLLRKAIRLEDGVLIDLNLEAGTKIKDHTNLRVNVRASRNIGSLNEIDKNIIGKIKIGIKYLLGVWTLLRGTGATATANVDLDGDGVVDTRINLLRFYEAGRMGSSGRLFSNNSPGFSISITQINPKSLGYLEVRSNKLNVVPNYLSDYYDVEHLKRALKFVIELLETNPLSEIVQKIENVETIKNEPEKYIMEQAFSGYHLIGGAENLLGENFEVGPYKNLYVCDASAISEFPSSNIHSTVVILADLCSKKFIKKYEKNSVNNPG